MAFPKLPKAIHAGEFLCITRGSSSDVWKVVYFMFVLPGLKSEGLYRISGFSDSVEEVKMAFDKGKFLWFLHVVIAVLISIRSQHDEWHCVLSYVYITFQINGKVTRLLRITVHLGAQVLSWHVALTQGFTLWTDRGGTSGGYNTMDVLSLP